MTKYFNFSAAFLSKKGRRYCLKKKAGWGPEMVRMQSKRRNSAACVRQQEHTAAQQHDVTSENPPLRQANGTRSS